MKLVPALASSVGNAYNDMEALMVFGRLCIEFQVRPLVDLRPSWIACEREVEEWKARDLLIWDDDEVVEKVAAFIQTLREHDPTLFDTAVSSGAFARIIGLIVSRLGRESRTIFSYTKFDYDGLAAIHSSYEGLARNAAIIADEPLTPDEHRSELRSIAAWLSQKKDDIAADLPLDPENDSYREGCDEEASDNVSVTDLFKDL